MYFNFSYIYARIQNVSFNTSSTFISQIQFRNFNYQRSQTNRLLTLGRTRKLIPPPRYKGEGAGGAGGGGGGQDPFPVFLRCYNISEIFHRK